ncbi:hypothetical protein EDC94DRAFT_650868 [Helicostylum pulchrum]|nr:hypothetical protein EDC94DRAFT_650868 [Helicostylum pulchrum]
MSSGILTVPEEERKYFFFLKDSDNKEANVSLLLQAIGFFYTLVVAFYLQLSEGEYVFSLMTMIPFAILRSIGTPRHTYPTSKTAFDNVIAPTFVLNFIYVYNNSNSIYAIMGPIYYVFGYYYKTDSIGKLETTLAIIYPVAYILGFRLWLYFITESFHCFLNMINIWKFTILQLRNQPKAIV